MWKIKEPESGKGSLLLFFDIPLTKTRRSSLKTTSISPKSQGPSTGPCLLTKTTSPSVALLWTLASRDSHTVADRELPQRGGYPSKDERQHTRAKCLVFRSTPVDQEDAPESKGTQGQA